jgi:outer membrane protein, heavy metal efflux system
MAVRLGGSLLALGLLTAGCQSQPPVAHFLTADITPREAQSNDILRGTVQSSVPVPAVPTVIRVAHEELPSSATQAPENIEGDAPLFMGAELSLDALVAAVEQRNPSLAGMVAAWQAAAQRYPQAVALDDPMLQFMMAPASVGSSEVEPAYAIQASQKFAWYGKRAARGQAATAEANAAYFDAEDGRIRLREATRFAFFDYYLVERNLELNGQDVRVMRELRGTALTKYQANQVTQQDVLQADVELADLDRRRIELDRTQRVAVARINTLLRRRPNAALPAVPRELAPIDAVPAAEQLEQAALAARPDLAALRARVEAEQAAVTLACKQYYPDVEVFGRYDTFWQPSSMADLRGQIGVSINLPVYHGKLNAAVNEALFRLNQRKSEYEERVLDIQYDVRSAYERLEESRKTVQLYAERMLPAAEQNVAVARLNYDVGKTTFLGLAQAQRQLIELREKHEEAIAEDHRRLAELDRVLAAPLPTSAASNSP